VTGPLLAYEQAAALLGVSERTVRLLVARGELPCVRIGRTVRFKPEIINRFVEAVSEPAWRGPLQGER
jgi:excisionase family DNA binding protein